MMKTKLKIQFYLFLVTLGVAIILYLIGGVVEQSLAKNVKFTYGYITDLAYKAYGNGMKTGCEYIVDNKKYSNEFYHNDYCYPERHNEFFFKKTPIIIAYDSTNAKVSEVLISRKKMKKYNYELPDSLKNIYEQYFFRCQ